MRKQNNKISVIVPVYNTEKYLDRCLSSIVNQSYKNIEIILIDDGSEDNSGEICDKWSLSDNRIKVLHQKNSGISATRNKGISMATGTYISFIDSDDSINQDMFKTMIDKIELDNSDIVVCNYNVIENNTICPGILSPPSNTFSTALIDDSIKSIGGYVWNKIYKRKIINGHFFNDNIHMMEDMLFNFSLINGRDISYSYIDIPYYNYFIQYNSLSHKKNINKLSEFIVLKYIIDYFKERNEFDFVFKFEARYIIEYGYYNYLFRKNKDYMNLKNELIININQFIKVDKLLRKKISFFSKLKIFLIIYLNPLYFFVKRMRSE